MDSGENQAQVEQQPEGQADGNYQNDQNEMNQNEQDYQVAVPENQDNEGVEDGADLEEQKQIMGEV